MKYVGFNGREYNINPSEYKLNLDDTTAKSKYHLRARKVLREMFPGDIILEEVALPGSSTGNIKTLFVDFLIETYHLGIEVHGEQHYKYNSHFFKNKSDFFLALKRDRIKKEWCELNNVLYIELKYSEDDNEWRRRIKESIC